MKAPKSQYNKFSKFNYRSTEDILEALKPLLKKYDITSIRIGRNLFTKASLLNVVYKKIYHSKLKRTGLQIADYFGSAPDFRSYIQSRGIHAAWFPSHLHQIEG